MARLQLYLKGTFFQEADIELPNFRQRVEDQEMNFQINCKIREDYIKREAEIMRINYLRQIIKSAYDYEIYFIMDSKINHKINTIKKEEFI